MLAMDEKFGDMSFFLFSTPFPAGLMAYTVLELAVKSINR